MRKEPRPFDPAVDWRGPDWQQPEGPEHVYARLVREPHTSRVLVYLARPGWLPVCLRNEAMAYRDGVAYLRASDIQFEVVVDSQHATDGF